MGLKTFKRYSRHITRGPRWKAIRVQALQRDGWKCVQCGEKVGLEIDHIKPVRDRPDLAWSLDNLQSLCGRCHARKTRTEAGLKPLPPTRQAWRSLLQKGL
ncbi:MAG: endonuclease [Ponticaulis sp.]|nr:endonuclease [Ponticaulis sp.]